MSFEQFSNGFTNEQALNAIAENEYLKESYASMANAILAMEDKGWSLVGAVDGEKAFSLEHLHRVSEVIRESSEGNPLLKRGCGLRTSYIFGRGVSFSEQPPRIVKLMKDPQNQDVLFSPEAQVINERSHFTDGQFFVLGNVSTKRFQRIPFGEITAVVTDPDDMEQVRYYRRSWSRAVQDFSNGKVSTKNEKMEEWYPADTYEPLNGRFVSSIGGVKVNAGYRMFASRVNRRAGNIWGTPDALPALPWAHAYNEYLKDGSRMLKALSMFAWQLKSKTKTGATTAAASVANPAVSGSVAITGDGMELSALPRTGSTIDLTNGRPLGSMVASALEVSVVALLSDPGTSGAYGTAQTLDVPTVKAMEARQAVWTNFYFRVMKFFGAKIETLEINWPKIETEPSQRMMQALALAHESGALFPDEFRNAVVEVLDIAKLHDGLPNQDTTSNSGGSIVPSQGNSGAVGSMQNNANDLQQADAKPTA